jgi:hypothetical protein
MRLRLAAIVMVGLPAAAAAQSLVPPSSGFASLPPIGLPLPQIGLPLPILGLPSPTETNGRSNDRRPPGAIANQQHRTIVFFVPAYWWGHPYTAQAPTPRPPDKSAERPEQKRLTGTLHLVVQPGGPLELYVDGYYVGTLDSYYNGEVELEAGPHRIEVRADGYETLHIDVNIPAQRAISYRGKLKAAATKPPQDSALQTPKDAPPAPTTFYMIPGCYFGNIPPKDAKLPATCDESRVVTFKQ